MSDYWTLRLAEVEREKAAGYYGRQPGQPAGMWLVDGGHGLMDGSRAVGEQPVKRSWRDTPSGQSWMGS